MKKMLGLLLTAVTLVAAVPKTASAGNETSTGSRCGALGATSGLCQGRGTMPPVGGGSGKRRLPPVSGGKHWVPPAPIGKR
jgi:hypothetical protein